MSAAVRPRRWQYAHTHLRWGRFVTSRQVADSARAGLCPASAYAANLQAGRPGVSDGDFAAGYTYAPACRPVLLLAVPGMDPEVVRIVSPVSSFPRLGQEGAKTYLA